ncbi:MAG: TIGR00341 family protein, partial [Bacteroidetes bacterium]
MAPNTPTPTPPREAWRQLVQGIIDWFHDFIDLRDGMDQEGTIILIRNGRTMRGANAWMLICSIMIASLGLDLDSSAVIIGAMLISPLMSPILGIGLGISINDRETLFTSLRHFGISIAIALVTSTLYFYLTPLGTFTSMIEARTEPTFLDSLVAIFGGLAGIISITRKDKSNAIPGVAIATALMPPLCVTGYGIANGELNIALSSFYLFFLNSFFIALSSYLIIRWLKFPYRQHPDPLEEQRARWVVASFSLLLIVPGLFILQKVVKDLRYQQTVKSFVEGQFGTDCLNYQVFELAPDSNLLIVELLNRSITDSLHMSYQAKLANDYGIKGTELRIIPDYQLELDRLSNRNLESEQLNRLTMQLEEVRRQQMLALRQDSLEQALRQQQTKDLDSLRLSQLLTTLKQAQQFASIDTLAYGKTFIAYPDGVSSPLPLFLAHWSDQMTNRTR